MYRETVPPTDRTVWLRLLHDARAAYEDHAWTRSHAAFADADRTGSLEPGDLALMATSAYMLGHVQEMLELLERAHHAHLDAGDRLASARTGLWLATNLMSRGKIPQASGWIERCERLLVDAPQDCVERGYLLMPQMLREVFAEAFDDVVTIAGEAARIGRRFDDPDLTALAAQTQGRALLKLARTEEGLRVLDEVMVTAAAARLSPMVTGLVYCSVLEGCFESHAIVRAATWTRELADWCGTQPDLVAFNDRCLAHRSEVLRLEGAWDEAVEEAERARTFGARHRVAAQAAYQIAEINRVRGDLERAAEWYREVIRDGGDPMPGLAQLEVAQGDPQAALDSLRDAIADTDDAHEKAALLPAYVEIALATGDQTGAVEAAESLTRIARETDADVHTAWATRAQGQVALADRRIPEAVRSLREAAEAWRDLSVPYELARTRVDLGIALEKRNDSGAARVELEAARAVFGELGAIPDVRRVDGLLHPGDAARPGGLTDRELEVLRMLTTGATNRAIAADLVVSERTIDRHVSNIFTKLGVSTRAAATAFAIRNGLA